MNKNFAAIVTNRHVVENIDCGIFSATDNNLALNEPFLRGLNIRINNFSEEWQFHPDNNVDLAVMPLSSLVRECIKQYKKKPFFTKIDFSTIPKTEEWKNYIPTEEILMIGYPEGLSDDINNLPFYKKGITSTPLYINYKSNENFIVNVPGYSGSSGSPIFLIDENFRTKSRTYQHGPDKARLLGIAYGCYIYRGDGKLQFKKIQYKSGIPTDLTVAIKSTKLLELEKILEQSHFRF
jgi:hypothetical protein